MGEAKAGKRLWGPLAALPGSPRTTAATSAHLHACMSVRQGLSLLTKWQVLPYCTLACMGEAKAGKRLWEPFAAMPGSPRTTAATSAHLHRRSV